MRQNLHQSHYQPHLCAAWWIMTMPQVSYPNCLYKEFLFPLFFACFSFTQCSCLACRLSLLYRNRLTTHMAIQREESASACAYNTFTLVFQWFQSRWSSLPICLLEIDCHITNLTSPTAFSVPLIFFVLGRLPGSIPRASWALWQTIVTVKQQSISLHHSQFRAEGRSWAF